MYCNIKNINTLMHKIFFLKNDAKDATEPELWINIFYSFASVKPLNNSSYYYSTGVSFGNIISTEYFIFFTRYNKNINIDLRIQFKNNLYTIKRIININEKNHYLKIIALKII